MITLAFAPDLLGYGRISIWLSSYGKDFSAAFSEWVRHYATTE